MWPVAQIARKILWPIANGLVDDVHPGLQVKNRKNGGLFFVRELLERMCDLLVGTLTDVGAGGGKVLAQMAEGVCGYLFSAGMDREWVWRGAAVVP